MANISEMTQIEVDNFVRNSRVLYISLIRALEKREVVPTIQAKHERVYIRKAVEGELIKVEADNAVYTAKEDQYVVYNDDSNRYLVAEKAFKRYVLDDKMTSKKDRDGMDVLGYKPKGKPQLIVSVNDLEDIIDLKGFTYFPSGWWGSTNTIEEGFVMVLPFDATKSLNKNIENFKKSIASFPKPGVPKEDVSKYLSSGAGFDCYAIDKGHVHTYALCDREGTFADKKLREKANQKAFYQGQDLDLSFSNNGRED